MCVCVRAYIHLTANTWGKSHCRSALSPVRYTGLQSRSSYVSLKPVEQQGNRGNHIYVEGVVTEEGRGN